LFSDYKEGSTYITSIDDEFSMTAVHRNYGGDYARRLAAVSFALANPKRQRKVAAVENSPAIAFNRLVSSRHRHLRRLMLCGLRLLVWDFAAIPTNQFRSLLEAAESIRQH
jgi:hypothetical protein